ncbi:hypothetical protein [Spiroplasma endosymbiont of Tricholauxania praeusta]|uniref:hypothetical protein n=1 Tax=Spiroplasma endosymbiont of Tricholauxania praeusta TaxID=3066296 RepID=UPI0030D05344
MLIEKINILKKAKEELDKEIFFIEKKSEEIVEQIESLENKIKRLKKLKKSKKIQLFSNINKQIKKTELNIKTLIEEIDENEKNAQPFKNSKLNILKEIIDLQGQLYENEVKRYKEIFEQLDSILKNKNFEELEHSIYPSKKNPFEEDGDTELFDSISLSATQIKDLEQKIFDFEEKNKEILDKIDLLECDIQDLREKKAEKNWQITFVNTISFGIFKYVRNKKVNKEIKKIKLKTRNLREEINENEKNIKPLKVLKLNIFENIINLQVSLINKITNEKNEEIFNKLNLISENEISKQFDEKNPFSSKKELISRVNSQYSELGFETDIEKNQSCFSLPNEDKTEEKLSSSLRSINSL